MNKSKCLMVLIIMLASLFMGCAQQLSTGIEDAQKKEATTDVSASAEESAAQSEISMDDLDMVNEYIKGVGADEMTFEVAEDFNNRIQKNLKTDESKSAWQLIVDFVRNEASEGAKELDYLIEFKDSSFSVLGNEWAPLHFQPEDFNEIE